MSECIWITGGGGDLARHIQTVFQELHDQVMAPTRHELDVTDPASVEAFATEQPTPDLLICQAGIAENALLARCSEDAWDRQIEVNLHGTYRCVQRVLPAMVARQSGHLIFISSHAAIHPAPGQAAYASAKAGLIGFAKSLAAEVGPDGLRVNVILPGFLETRMTRDLSPQRLEQVKNEHHLKRFNTPDAVAQFIRHLHRELPHTSGQIFALDSR